MRDSFEPTPARFVSITIPTCVHGAPKVVRGAFYAGAAALSRASLSERTVVPNASQSGLGKTMIAQNIAHAAILSGHSVLFVSAADLLLDLAAQESASRLERCRHFYAKIGSLRVGKARHVRRGSRRRAR